MVRVLEFFDLSEAYSTVDHSPFIETVTSLSFTNIFLFFL